MPLWSVIIFVYYSAWLANMLIFGWEFFLFVLMNDIGLQFLSLSVLVLMELWSYWMGWEVVGGIALISLIVIQMGWDGNLWEVLIRDVNHKGGTVRGTKKHEDGWP